jgi:hypothetical protein
MNVNPIYGFELVFGLNLFVLTNCIDVEALIDFDVKTQFRFRTTIPI